jgi:alanine-synthesizing transaminase
MTFSRRTSLGVSPPSALARALEAARGAGRPPVLDLTASNPTTVGLPYDAQAITSSIGTSRSLVYEPTPFGLRSAREAVATQHYAASGIEVRPEQVAITASTSEAYAVLFKMLCDPGDEILVPVPSYPLLAWLSAFEGIVLRPYPLVYAGRWHVDHEALTHAVGPRTRAIIVVSPNNPTGSYLGASELAAMLDLGLPIVSDEVFAPYPLQAGGVPADRVDSVLRGAARRPDALVFALSGLSKLAGLPQLKLGWIACGGGDEARVRGAMERLEIVLDAYLSVGAPVQHALPDLLRASVPTADAIRGRTRTNLTVVRTVANATPAMTLLDVEGGWYATLRVPETYSDEEWALALLDRDAVYVQPGYFFDMGRGAHLVVSLLTPENDLEEGMRRLGARVSADA